MQLFKRNVSPHELILFAVEVVVNRAGADRSLRATLTERPAA